MRKEGCYGIPSGKRVMVLRRGFTLGGARFGRRFRRCRGSGRVPVGSVDSRGSYTSHITHTVVEIEYKGKRPERSVTRTQSASRYKRCGASDSHTIHAMQAPCGSPRPKPSLSRVQMSTISGPAQPEDARTDIARPRSSKSKQCRRRIGQRVGRGATEARTSPQSSKRQ